MRTTLLQWRRRDAVRWQRKSREMPTMTATHQHSTIELQPKYDSYYNGFKWNINEILVERTRAMLLDIVQQHPYIQWLSMEHKDSESLLVYF